MYEVQAGFTFRGVKYTVSLTAHILHCRTTRDQLQNTSVSANYAVSTVLTNFHDLTFTTALICFVTKATCFVIDFACGFVANKGTVAAPTCNLVYLRNMR